MIQYQEIIREILKQDPVPNGRTGTETRRVLGVVKKYDLRGMKLPLVTGKETKYLAAFDEQINLFIAGKRNVSAIVSKIWDAWARNGDLGPVYGVQARRWKDYQVLSADRTEFERDFILKNYIPVGTTFSGDTIYYRQVDQLARAIHLLRTDPSSRQIVVNHWNAGQLEMMALPPCHMAYQFISTPTEGKPELTLILYQRSADVFLGVPFNIAQYALLAHMVAQVTGHTAVELAHVTGDTHLYDNQWSAAEDYLEREIYGAATLMLNPAITEIDDFEMDDIEVDGYEHGPFMPIRVVV